MTFTEDLAQGLRDIDRLKTLQEMIDDHLIDNQGELVIRAGPSQIELTADGITLVHGQTRIDLAQLSNMFLMYQWLLESQILPPGIRAQVTSNPEVYQGGLLTQPDVPGADHEQMTIPNDEADPTTETE